MSNEFNILGAPRFKRYHNPLINGVRNQSEWRKYVIHAFLQYKEDEGTAKFDVSPAEIKHWLVNYHDEP